MQIIHLSSAFDVIDHGIMLTWLQHSFGVTAETLDWKLRVLAMFTPV